jgi:hypothetical protein
MYSYFLDSHFKMSEQPLKQLLLLLVLGVVVVEKVSGQQVSFS